MNRHLRSIVERAYLVDPARTDQELRSIEEHALATLLKVDHDAGRIAENFRMLTGKVVSVTKPREESASMLGGAVISASAEESGD